MPTYDFWGKVEYIRILIFSSIILCVILGGVVAYAFTGRNYKPIQKLVQALIKEDILSFESKYAEYGYIRKAIYDTLIEKNRIAKTLEKKDDLFKNSILVRFMKTNNDSIKEVREILCSYDKNPDEINFSVVLFNIDQSDSSSADGKNEENAEMNRFIVFNIVNEMVNRTHFGLMVDLGDMLACIIGFKNQNRNDCSREIYHIITDAKQFIYKNFDLSFTVSIGSMHKGVNGIGKSYREALDAFDAPIFADQNGIMVYDDISNQNVSFHYPMNIEHKLANLIGTGDYDNAYTLLQEIFKKNFNSESFSVELVKCLMFDIVSTFIKVSETVSDVNFMEEMEPFKKLAACTSVTQMKEEVSLMLKLVCEHAKQNIKEKNDNLSFKVIEYINANYHDVNLSVNMIADHFGITSIYLSSLFKRQTKEKLLDTINRIRIEKSKQLLKGSKINIGRISEMVGYSNSTVFIRNFKKYEGITPGQFIEIS